jgi:hypothetical protein
MCSDRDKGGEVTEIRILILLNSNSQTCYIPCTPSNHKWVDNIKMDLRERGWVVWTGSIWLRIGTSGGLL